MKSTKKELKDSLKPAIENLVCQETRLIHFKRMGAPAFVMEGTFDAIKELKRELVNLMQTVAQPERPGLIKQMIGEAVEEEIERTVQLRGNPCLRCTHLRYYDWEMNPHEEFPMGASPAKAIGCDEVQAVSLVRCERFIETAGAVSAEEYIDEMNLLYELREMFEKMKEIWEEYLAIEG